MVVFGSELKGFGGSVGTLGAAVFGRRMAKQRHERLRGRFPLGHGLIKGRSGLNVREPATAGQPQRYERKSGYDPERS